MSNISLESPAPNKDNKEKLKLGFLPEQLAWRDYIISTTFFLLLIHSLFFAEASAVSRTKEFFLLL